MIGIALLTIFLAQVQPHNHPPVLPAPDNLWSSCCGNADCREAPMSVGRLSEQMFSVQIADYPPVLVPASKVHLSQNGKGYFCTRLAELPPTSENILCVFYVVNVT